MTHDLRTVAEATHYKATSRHADVTAFIEALAPRAQASKATAPAG